MADLPSKKRVTVTVEELDLPVAAGLGQGHRAEVGQYDLAPVQGVELDANRAFKQDEDIGRPILVADHRLARSECRHAAVRFKLRA